MDRDKKKRPNVIRHVAKLNLLWLLSESKNFRNDGWTQEGYREKYRKALYEYIRDYSSLREIERE